MKTGLIVLFLVLFFMVSSLQADVIIITNIDSKTTTDDDVNIISVE